jgi:hypothetical protein
VGSKLPRKSILGAKRASPISPNFCMLLLLCFKFFSHFPASCHRAVAVPASACPALLRTQNSRASTHFNLHVLALALPLARLLDSFLSLFLCFLEFTACHQDLPLWYPLLHSCSQENTSPGCPCSIHAAGRGESPGALVVAYVRLRRASRGPG